MNVLLIAELSTLIVILIISFCTNDLLHLSGISVENDPIQWLSFAHSQSSQQENWLAKGGNFTEYISNKYIDWILPTRYKEVIGDC